MATNKLKFDFGIAPNVDGLSEQKLIAHSVNVESLADGSGVRTRSGMRHAYPFRVYTDTTSNTTQIISGLRTPNAENVNGMEVGIDIVYSIDENGKYIIKDMKQTKTITPDEQVVTFTHAKSTTRETPAILVYSDDGLNYYLVFNRLSGTKKVVVNYIIGLIQEEGETVSYKRSVVNYTYSPSYTNVNNDRFIVGTLNLTDQDETLIRSVNSYSIVGRVELKEANSFVKIPIAWPQFEEGDVTYLETAFLPITLSFSVYDNDVVDYMNFIKTTDLKVYAVSDINTVDNPFILTDQSGQSNMVYFDCVYPQNFVGNTEG